MINYVVKINNELKSMQFDVVDDQAVGLHTDMFLSIDEIVYDITMNRLSDDDKQYFKGCSDGDLAMEHLGFGMWIRNTYALWNINNPLSENNPAPDSTKHPDNLSGEIIRLVRKTLNGEYLPSVDLSCSEEQFNEAMTILRGE